jgi:hypothetical protein
VVRTFRFQSRWDGRDTDSSDHRTHMAFAAEDGSCPSGFRPIPRLVQRVVYDVLASGCTNPSPTTATSSTSSTRT